MAPISVGLILFFRSKKFLGNSVAGEDDPGRMERGVLGGVGLSNSPPDAGCEQEFSIPLPPPNSPEPPPTLLHYKHCALSACLRLGFPLLKLSFAVSYDLTIFPVAGEEAEKI